MNRFLNLSAIVLAFAVVNPAHAEKSDRIMVENLRARIMAVRSDVGVNGAGTVELSEAEARLRELSKALDNNEAADARAAVNGIDALIAAAQLRANAAVRVSEAAPARWTSPPAPVLKRKRISYSKPQPRTRPVCRIASR